VSRPAASSAGGLDPGRIRIQASRCQPGPESRQPGLGDADRDRLMLALPGSAYLYQGEELGLHEVGDLPDELLQDPAFEQSGHAHRGRDGCRVPLPWTTDGPSFGFGAGAAHLPQPAWFGVCSVEAQDSRPDSTLALYRQALSWRWELRTVEKLEWEAASSDHVLHFSRPGGWRSVTNFGAEPVALPAGTVVIASATLDGGRLPADATAWILDPPQSA
jgi:alpha-glucosidase